MSGKRVLWFQLTVPCLFLLLGSCSTQASSIQSILDLKGLEKSHLGMLVEDEEGILFSLNPQRQMIPASLTKIITAAAAFELLKPQYEFKTQLLTDGIRKGNTIEGSLYIKGGGDPSFTAEKLPQLVRLLKDHQISRIEGSLVIDNFRFQDPVFINAGKVQKCIGGWNRNGYPLFVNLDPPRKYSPLPESRIRSVITPKKNRDFVVYWNMNQPDLWTGHKFLSLMRQSGIEISGNVKRGKTPDEARPLAQIESSIGAIISQMMKASSNYYAEMVARNLAAAVSGTPVTTEQGMLRIQEFLDHVGIPRREYVIRSGAGFSKQNTISAGNLCKVLNHMKTEQSIFSLFKNSFAVAGVDGTLKDRMRHSSAKGKILAKTGKLNRVVGLAGYAVRSNGKLLTFAFVYNGPRSPKKVQAAFDRLCEELINL